MAGNIKAITQDTFDCVVQENICDFGMDEKEAVDDAIEQFTSQVFSISLSIWASFAVVVIGVIYVYKYIYILK